MTTQDSILKSYLSALPAHDFSAPLAAVSTLTGALSTHRTTTAAETLSTLDTLSQTLYTALRARYLSNSTSDSASTPDPKSKSAPSSNPESREERQTKAILSTYPAKAGADLFQRLIVTTLQRPQQSPSSSTTTTSSTNTAGTSITSTTAPQDSTGTSQARRSSQSKQDETSRAALDTLTKSFLERGLIARQRIKEFGRRIVGDSQTVVVPLLGTQATLSLGILRDAASKGILFDVLFIVDDKSPTRQSADSPSTMAQSPADLKLGDDVLVSSCNASQFPARLNTVIAQKGVSEVFVLAEAEALLADGGALLNQGCTGVFTTAKRMGCNIWCAAEGRGCLRWFPLNGEVDVPLPTDLKSRTEDGAGSKSKGEGGGVHMKEADEGTQQQIQTLEVVAPDLISGGYITEMGVQSAAAIAEEVLRLWC